MSTVFRVLQATPTTASLIYWGNQESFYQVDGSSRGGAHFGLQQSGTNKLINWGGYDDIVRRRIQAGTTAPTGGTFTLSYLGQTTAAIARNASGATIQAALEALSNIAPGDISVVGGPLPALVTMRWTPQAAWGSALITLNGASLTGGTLVIDGGGSPRGTFPTLTYTPGTEVSPFYDWVTGEDYLMEVYRSPKQDYLAGELTTDADHPSASQAVGEVAWRLDVTRVSTGVKTTVRDLLYPNCKASGAMYGATSWAEDFNNTTAPTTTVPWEVRWSGYRLDNRLVPTASLQYGTDPSSNTNTDINVADKVGFRMKSVAVRTTATNNVLSHPGPVVRTWSKANNGESLLDTLTLARPLDVVAADRLLAVIGTSGDRSITPSDWDVVFSGPAAAGNIGRVHILTKLVGADPPATYSFLLSGGAGPFAGAILALMGADQIAPALVGTVGQNAETTDAWTAPALSTSTNFGRVFYALVVRPNGLSPSIPTPVGAVEIVDANVSSGEFLNLAVGEDPTPRGAALAPQRSGTLLCMVPHAIVVEDRRSPARPGRPDPRRRWSGGDRGAGCVDGPCCWCRSCAAVPVSPPECRYREPYRRSAGRSCGSGHEGRDHPGG
jgi:hypothetical protein